MTSNSKINSSSNRSFGLVFFVIFLIVALWPLKSGEHRVGKKRFMEPRAVCRET